MTGNGSTVTRPFQYVDYPSQKQSLASGEQHNVIMHHIKAINIPQCYAITLFTNIMWITQNSSFKLNYLNVSLCTVIDVVHTDNEGLEGAQPEAAQLVLFLVLTYKNNCLGMQSLKFFNFSSVFFLLAFRIHFGWRNWSLQ